MKGQIVMMWVALCLVVASKPRIVTAALTEEEAKFIFGIHNYIRSEVWPPAADMQLVRYSVELEERAEAWANLNFNRIHPNPDDYADVAVGIGYIYDTAGNSVDALEQILGRMAEPGDTYNYETNECDGDCLTYKQIISATVRSVGCALYVYNVDDELKSYRLACLYHPRPDLSGKPYIAGEPCSKCNDGQYCRNDFCSDVIS